MSETTTWELCEFEESTIVYVVRGPDCLGVSTVNNNKNRLALAREVAAKLNALESIPDPAKFVEVFGEMREALELLMRHKRVVECIQSESDELHDELIEALAAAKEVTR